MRPVINSEKKIVQLAQSEVAAGTLTSIQVARARDTPDVAAIPDVQTGTVIKAIYVEFWIIGAAAAPVSFNMNVEKTPGVAAAMTFTESVTLNAYANKKNVLYVTQGLIGDDTTNPVPVIRSWIKIPKGKQRLGLDDRLRINVSALGASLDICGVVIYKAYS